MRSVRAKTLCVWLAGAIALASVTIPVAAQAQVTASDVERRLAIQQRQMDQFESFLRRYAAAAESGDCALFGEVDASYFTDFAEFRELTEADFPRGWYRSAYNRKDAIYKRSGCMNVRFRPSQTPLPPLRPREPDWDADLYQHFKDRVASLQELRNAGQCEGSHGYAAGLERLKVDLDSTFEQLRNAGVDLFRIGRPVVEYFNHWHEVATIVGCNQAGSALTPVVATPAPPPRSPAPPPLPPQPPPAGFPELSPEDLAAAEGYIDAAERALAEAERARLAGRCTEFYVGLRVIDTLTEGSTEDVNGLATPVPPKIPHWMGRDIAQRREELGLLACPPSILVNSRPPARLLFEGEFDTNFGRMSLSQDGGTYDAQSARIVIDRVDGNVVEGTWQQDSAAERCADGSYRGRFRFTFTATGFTGAYGRCGEAPSREWSGTRRAAP